MNVCRGQPSPESERWMRGWSHRLIYIYWLSSHQHPATILSPRYPIIHHDSSWHWASDLCWTFLISSEIYSYSKGAGQLGPNLIIVWIPHYDGVKKLGFCSRIALPEPLDDIFNTYLYIFPVNKRLFPVFTLLCDGFNLDLQQHCKSVFSLCVCV